MAPQARNTKNWLLVTIASIASCLASADAAAQLDQKQSLAGEQFENIQVLAEMPADQMGKVMNIMSESLGVGCAHCHDNYNFANEGVERKDIAREMLLMTFKLNQEHFQGKSVISCNTCHRGHARPVSAMALGAGQPPREVVQPADVPTVDSVWAKYFSALGGEENLDAVQNQKLTAQRIEPDGRTEPEYVWQTASGKLRMLTEYGPVSVVAGFDGAKAWKKSQEQRIQLKADEVTQMRREVLLAFPTQQRQYFKGLEFAGRELLEGREVDVLARTMGKQTERLMFDVQSGLLARSTASVPTILADFVYQIDYRDYKEFEKIKLPTRVEYAMPGVHWVRQILEVQSNVKMDEALFREK